MTRVEKRLLNMLQEMDNAHIELTDAEENLFAELRHDVVEEYDAKHEVKVIAVVAKEESTNGINENGFIIDGIENAFLPVKTEINLQHFAEPAPAQANAEEPRIEINNEITKKTVMKMIYQAWNGYDIEQAGYLNSTAENLDNGFITLSAAKQVLWAFHSKANNSYRNTTKAMFGTRTRCDWVAKKLAEEFGLMDYLKQINTRIK